MKLQSLIPLAASVVTLGITSNAAKAAVTITTGALVNSAYTVSTSDLLHTYLASISMTGGFNSNFPSSNLTVLSDGLFGDATMNTVNSFAASVAVFRDSTITFSLDLAASPLGYNLDEIETYAGWDEGRDGQAYSVLYSQVNSPNTFLPLLTVPQFNPQGHFSFNSSKISVNDSTGVFLAENVAKLRFSFPSFENDGTAYREIDVFGVAAAPIPEPSSFALIAGVGSLVLCLSRRGRSRV